MDSTQLSLDDIIKKKKFNTKPGFRAGKAGKGPKKPIGGGGAVKKFTPAKSPNKINKKPVIDARNKIIQKNRAKITDARDKLAQIAKRSGDARFKLLKKNINSLKKFKFGKEGIDKIMRQGTAPKAAPVRGVGVKHGATFNRAVKDIMEIDYEEDEYSPNLRRTVKNDIAYKPAAVSSMPPLPTFNKYLDRMETRPIADYDDPFDCYEVPVARPYDVSEPRNLNRAVREAHMDAYPRKGILRTTSSNGSSAMGYERGVSSQYREPASSKSRYIADENSHLSHEMRTRLQRVPDVSQSVGIFSNPYSQASREPRHVTSAGYRIVVSNLHSSVSQSDIKELFEDVGPLIDARLVRTGVAEVIFEKLKDAETAVETYHNRQLDGQPMKCLLVNPRSSNLVKPAVPTLKPTRSNPNKASKVEIDIDALHSVLFRRH